MKSYQNPYHLFFLFTQCAKVNITLDNHDLFIHNARAYIQTWLLSTFSANNDGGEVQVAKRVCPLDRLGFAGWHWGLQALKALQDIGYVQSRFLTR